jgi:hypothetical protein
MEGQATTTAQADGGPTGEFRAVGIIGGGLMGTGIAKVVASAGIAVTLG